MTIKTLYVIEGTHPSHRFAEILGGLFGDRVDRVCVQCLAKESSAWAESPCDRLDAPLVSGVGGVL